jgi:protein SCO1
VKKGILLLLILVFPTVAYLLLTTGKHQFTDLPYYGNKVPGEKEGDTLYHSIPDFELIDQDGKPYGSKDLDGKIYVANFFFTTCPSICKEMQTLMKKVHDEDDFEKLNDFRLVSFTVDPERDTPEKLRQFRDEVHATPGRWQFLTGSKQQIYDLAYKGFLANAMEDSLAPGGFLHSDMLVLIDREKHIRGIYQGTQLKDVKRLIDEIKVLIAGYNASKKENTNPVN